VSVLQTVSLIAVLVSGTAVVAAGDPVRQLILLGIFGLALTLLFFVLQAPDVALSEIVVGAMALPLIVLAALRKLREQEHDTRGADR
jgi:uncharacterized MnhB-related membrane protein